MPESTACAVVGVPDLFFSAKIAETAKHAGVAVAMAGNAETLVARAAEGAAVVLLDLGASQLDPIGVIRRLKAESATAQIPVVGFANHENIADIENARAAGCDQVMTRGAFSNALPSLLKGIA